MTPEATPPSDTNSWGRRVVAAIMILSFTSVTLNLFSPTDFPRQPGDDWRDLGKFYVAVAVTWLILRWDLRRDKNRPPTVSDVPGKPNSASTDPGEGKIEKSAT